MNKKTSRERRWQFSVGAIIIALCMPIVLRALAPWELMKRFSEPAYLGLLGLAFLWVALRLKRWRK